MNKEELLADLLKKFIIEEVKKNDKHNEYDRFLSSVSFPKKIFAGIQHFDPLPEFQKSYERFKKLVDEADVTFRKNINEN